MGLKIGIVGLPNVGKSTLFNSLTRSSAAAVANYPFCTIEPNIGVVAVPDKRIEEISTIVQPAKIIRTSIEFVDIAGLVKGASKGDGLGNQFLAHIRECDAIALAVRFFDDPTITHVHDRIDPKQDIEIISTELMLSDLQTVGKRLIHARNEAKGGDKEKKEYLILLERLLETLKKGELANSVSFEKEEFEKIRDLHLLTQKPLLFIANVSEKEINSDQSKWYRMTGIPEHYDIIPISAKLEAEVNELSEEEADEYLKELGVTERGLPHLIRTAYKTLNLETFFTAGPKEVRAWTIGKGTLAPQAAGIIHSDFEKGFIRAEVIAYEDFVESAGEAKAKEKGLLRVEGKDYVVKDGDIMHFRFHV